MIPSSCTNLTAVLPTMGYYVDRYKQLLLCLIFQIILLFFNKIMTKLAEVPGVARGKEKTLKKMDFEEENPLLISSFTWRSLGIYETKRN